MAAAANGKAHNAAWRRPLWLTDALLHWPGVAMPLLLVVFGGLALLAASIGMAPGSKRGNGGRGVKRGNGGRGGSGFLFMLMASSGSAHNWLRSIKSRANNRASTVRPCRPRTQFAHPHIQVNANSTFVMEWATGHQGRTDFVVVHARDEQRLGSIGKRVVSKYIREEHQFESSPGAARALFQGPYWHRNFLGRAPQYLQASGVPGGCLQTRRPTYCYLRPLPGNDPSFVHRPWGGGIADRYTGMRNGYLLNDQAGNRLRTSPENDHRLAYHNPNLPFIVMAHRFKIAFHHPQAADTAHFRFPPGTPPGMYVIYYMWGGYRDCVDVDVLPDHKPVPQTVRGIYGYQTSVVDSYVRTDHCQYAREAHDVAADRPPADGSALPAGRETCFAIPPEGARNSRGQTTDGALAACQARCAGTHTLFRPQLAYNPLRLVGGVYFGGGCGALNVVPLTPPPDVAFPNEQNIPWSVGGCTRAAFASEPAGSSICYGLREASRRTVESPWDVINDDPRGTRKP